MTVTLKSMRDAYTMRAEGEPWSVIGDVLGITANAAYCRARRWAAEHGMAWPVGPDRSGRVEYAAMASGERAEDIAVRLEVNAGTVRRRAASWAAIHRKPWPLGGVRRGDRLAGTRGERAYRLLAAGVPLGAAARRLETSKPNVSALGYGFAKRRGLPWRPTAEGVAMIVNDGGAR